MKIICSYTFGAHTHLTEKKFQVSHSETYKIYCKELVQATCKITSKITM